MTKTFGPTVALDRVSLTVAAGESHALVGRNGAGKSTLVSILTGLQAPDAGQVRFAGEPAPPLHDRQAWRRRVACVYQKSAIIPTLSVAENLFLHREHRGPGGAIRWRTVRARAQELLDDWGIAIDAARPAADLTVEQRQLTEIARALSLGARFIVLDEPTAQLDSAGIARLFARLREVQAARGVSLLFISHHLEEVYQVCQTVTVLRDARHVVTAPVRDLPTRELVAAMTGEAPAVLTRTGASTARDEPPALRLEGLGLAGAYDPIDLELRPGEVVGITGSASSGRIALAETVVGLRRADQGRVLVAGREPAPGDVPAALAAGVGFVPRDRHHQGFVPGLGVGENITMTVRRGLGRAGLVSPRRRDAVARALMARLSVVAAGPEQEVASLSGGNQQKVVLGRALASGPTVLVLMHPTAGVDVRSKAALLEVVDDVRRRGTAVLVVSDELEDLVPCDRVLALFQGAVVREFGRDRSDGDIVAAIEGLEVERA